MKHTIPILIFISLFFCPLSSCLGQNYLFTIEGNRLTLKGENILLLDILKKITEVRNIDIFSHNIGEIYLSADVENVPLEEGLVLLLKDYNYSLIYSSTDKRTERISGLFISGKSKYSTQTVIKSRKSFPEITNNIERLPEYTSYPGNMDLFHSKPLPKNLQSSPDYLDPLMRYDNRPDELPRL